MIANDAPHDAVAEYLGILEKQLGVPISSLQRRRSLASELAAAVEPRPGNWRAEPGAKT